MPSNTEENDTSNEGTRRAFVQAWVDYIVTAPVIQRHPDPATETE